MLQLRTERLLLAVVPPEQAAKYVTFYRENEAHFAPWDPPRWPGILDPAEWRGRLQTNADRFVARTSMNLGLFLGSDMTGPLIGQCNFNEVIRGAFESCILGYSLDYRHVGNGYMSEALRRAIAYAFDEFGLHRIAANYLPHNERSAAVLRRLGFAIEGRAQDYLYIDGAWREHVLTALTNPRPMLPGYVAQGG